MAELPAAEIARLSGIKAVNACSLAQCGLEGTALYPVYPLMNSYCYCNTMYTIHPDTKVTGTPGYLDVSAQYLSTILHSVYTVSMIYLFIQHIICSSAQYLHSTPYLHCMYEVSTQ